MSVTVGDELDTGNNWKATEVAEVREDEALPGVMAVGVETYEWRERRME